MATHRDVITAILRHVELRHRIHHYIDHPIYPDMITAEFWDTQAGTWRNDGVLTDVDDMMEMHAYWRCELLVWRGDAAGKTRSGT